MIKLPIARYQFTFKIIKSFRQPEFAGSMLRGCFGHALKKIACITKQKQCAGCLMIQNCSYPAIFETPPKAHNIQQFANIPNPYIIEPPPWGSKDYYPEDLYQFSMVLTGTALEQLSLLILVWQKVFQWGVSKEKGRGEFVSVQLVKENGNKQLIYQAGSENILEHDKDYLFEHNSNSVKTEQLQIKLLTLLRLQKYSKGVGPDKLKARDFLVTLLRRINLVNEFHNNIILIKNFEHFSQLAETITIKPELKWQNWTRYSNRQHQKMLLGGVTGQFNLQGDLQEFLPFLALGQYLHVGKNTTFGLGRYLIEDKC